LTLAIGQSRVKVSAVLNNQSHDLTDARNIVRRDCCAGWQNEHSVGHRLSRVQPGAGFGHIRAVRRQAMAAWVGVAPREDVLCTEDLEELIPGDSSTPLIDFDYNVLEIAFFALVKVQ
jgi:hypothetical protein